ncbi:hypothetical protein XELAEV_18025418mg [Xenopus laevis]|uniref:Uncharacterized protein n=1 Tax=Xenopus laevis TaxID=8355 RepID=A0A974CZS0_XENLA|nr:hypothetical protein XELAEV_18025418mg [Xenopus laevis]
MKTHNIAIAMIGSFVGFVGSLLLSLYIAVFSNSMQIQLSCGIRFRTSTLLLVGYFLLKCFVMCFKY